MNLSKESIKIKFDHTPTIKSETKYVQNVLNLMVEKISNRCFSPLTEDVCSPGLSPIFGPDDLPEDFKFPKPISYANNNNNKKFNQSSPNNGQQENSSFELDLSTSTKWENSSLELSTQSEISQISNVLDRTMDVTVLLKEIGLGKYSEIFAKAGIGLEQFLTMKASDLQNLGFKTDDCKEILQMIEIFNLT